MQSANLLLVKILVKLFALLPFRLLYVVSDFFFFLLFYVVKYRRQIVATNLSNSFPEKTPPETKAISKQYYHHLCDLLVETIKGLSLPEAELRRRFVFLNPEIFPKGKSAILLGSHFGNWEWGTLSIPLNVEHTVLGIYKPLKNKLLDKYFSHLRKQWGLHLAPMSKAGRAVVEYRDKPTIFVLIADQTPVDVKNAHWLDFLHQDPPFLHGADKLARRTGLPVFYVEINKIKRGFYEVTTSQICEAEENLAEGEITRRYAAALETSIHKQPAFWLWSHRRWKRKRPGE